MFSLKSFTCLLLLSLLLLKGTSKFLAPFSTNTFEVNLSPNKLALNLLWFIYFLRFFLPPKKTEPCFAIAGAVRLTICASSIAKCPKYRYPYSEIILFYICHVNNGALHCLSLDIKNARAYWNVLGSPDM